MIQLEPGHRRNARDLLQKHKPFFAFLQQIEIAMESQDPQVPFEFDTELTEVSNSQKTSPIWKKASRITACGRMWHATPCHTMKIFSPQMHGWPAQSNKPVSSRGTNEMGRNQMLHQISEDSQT